MTIDRNHKEENAPRLVVGVGASAGGLDAFKELLCALPEGTRMAFVLVQHLDPSHKSLLTTLLARSTSMVVKEAEDGERLLADVIYVIPSDAALAVRNGRIELTHPPTQRGPRLLVDHLFGSLARDCGPNAVGIVLSGAGSDGSAGLRHIKTGGGLVIVQDPSTCPQAGMPQSAIDTGMVDLVLRIQEIPDALVRFERLPRAARPAATKSAAITEESRGAPQLSDETLDRLAVLLEPNAGFDLRAYKGGTIGRRVVRRMALGGHDSVETYLERVRQDPSEQKAIIRDLLISVTDFFRDAEAFEALRTAVVEPLVDAAQDGEPLRVWVPGCATGEEAYSIAIEFLAASERKMRRIALQIFATDLDEEALAVGRTGHYPLTIAERVPAEWLEKYFEPDDGQGFRVRPTLRDTVSFAVHDLTEDPPFSRMHLVSCRNLLIYLRAGAQENVLKALHFALLPSGYLFLGSSETTGGERELFSTVSKPWRIYRKVGVSRAARISRRGSRPPVGADEGRRVNAGPSRSGSAPGVADLARRLVMQARVPPSIVLADSGTVLYMHGELRPFLRFPEGEPRFDLASLVTPDLAMRTRAALYKCRRDRETVVAFSTPEGQAERTRITATPAFELGDGTIILSFERVAEPPLAEEAPADGPVQESVVEHLERELSATREDLRSTVEELESSNEELRAANEETTSMNEELQSANEELEATTEELRSLNEELTTVNGQLREKVEEVERAHDDLSNFFSSTKIATIFLDERLSIKRFTPAAEELLRVGRADEARFVGDIARELLQAGLVEDAREVLDHLTPLTRELRTTDGRWMTRSVLPYRTEGRRIEGVVVTWTDVTELKAATEELAVRERQQAVVARLGIRALEETLLERFLDQSVREIQQTLETDYCELLELQPDSERLLLRAGVGWKEGTVGQASVPSGMDSQAGFTLQTKGAVLVNDFSAERRFVAPQLLVDHDVRSGLTCVIGSGDDPYGVIGAHSRQPRIFTTEDVNFLQACASVISAAIVRHEVRARMLLERAAAESLTASQSLLDAARRIHAAAAEDLRVTLGELWQPTAEGAFERTSTFAAPPLTEATVEASFGPSRFAAEEGFVGRVASSKRAEWLSSLQNAEKFARVEAARALGLSSGLALPIVSGNELVGVFTLFSKTRLHADGPFLRSLEGIGRSIGDFVRRLDLERRFQMTVEAAPSGIADRSMDGRYLRVNHRFCEITGYSPEELLAQPFQKRRPCSKSCARVGGRGSASRSVTSARTAAPCGRASTSRASRSPRGSPRMRSGSSKTSHVAGQPSRRCAHRRSGFATSWSVRLRR
jgi:two-component system, chemotaxis family, CheB/CheR fusion protein